MADEHRQRMEELKAIEEHLRYLSNRIKQQYQAAKLAAEAPDVELVATQNWTEIRTAIKSWNILFSATTWLKNQLIYYEDQLQESTHTVGDVKKQLLSTKRHLAKFENEKEQSEKRFKVRETALEDKIKKVEIYIGRKKHDLGVLFSANKEAQQLMAERDRLDQDRENLAVSSAADIEYLEKSIEECEGEKEKLSREHDRPAMINRELKVICDLLKASFESSEAFLTVEEAILEKRFGRLTSSDNSDPFMLQDYTEIIAIQFLCQHAKQIADMSIKCGTDVDDLRDRLTGVISMYKKDFAIKQGELCVLTVRSGVLSSVIIPDVEVEG